MLGASGKATATHKCCLRQRLFASSAWLAFYTHIFFTTIQTPYSLVPQLSHLANPASSRSRKQLVCYHNWGRPADMATKLRGGRVCACVASPVANCIAGMPAGVELGEEAGDGGRRPSSQAATTDAVASWMVAMAVVMSDETELPAAWHGEPHVKTNQRWSPAWTAIRPRRR
ncbi:hypothetical protein EDB81DRAFT_283809 [Dactylonectria macrodidyma]|uniref:Uncharacterized protein n=1 Tax=Dactylonectria macrodidyma TaxID=307937 RepID=A0A9P9FNQ7_9HYPO|nr:hypothetical protein EDB81DRAFT_283809 [Dactylonectria macrodidyma]